MSGYIFRPPATAVDFSWKLEDVMAWLAKGRNVVSLRGHRQRTLGATIRVRSFDVDHTKRDGEFYVRVTLYQTDIARIYADRVEVGPVDTFQKTATRWWIERILNSNRGYGIVFSRASRYTLREYAGGHEPIDTPINNATFERTAK